MIKGLVHCFSMQVVMKKRFSPKSSKKFEAYPSCRFREKHKKRTFKFEKLRYRAEG